MTEREMIEIEKHWCENCCNWDKEKTQMDGYSECKLTGTSVFGQEYGGKCKCFNIPAENVIVPPCKVGDKYVMDTAKTIFKAWNDVTGAVCEKTSWYYELESIIEDIVKLSFGAGVLYREEAEQALKGGVE